MVTQGLPAVRLEQRESTVWLSSHRDLSLYVLFTNIALPPMQGLPISFYWRIAFDQEMAGPDDYNVPLAAAGDLVEADKQSCNDFWNSIKCISQQLDNQWSKQATSHR